MSDAESLSDILTGVSAVQSKAPEAQKAEPVTDVKPAEPAPAAPSAAKEVEAKAEAPADTQRDEQGRFKPKEAKEPKSEPMVPLSALLAERAKRKEPEPVAKPKPSVFDDEDGAISERVTEHLSPVREQIFNLSLELERSRHEDFDEVAKAFAEAAESDPKLWHAMQTAANPARYAYQVGRQIKELADVGGDIVKYGEKKTAEVRAELEKEKTARTALETQIKELQKQMAELQALPSSLNKVSSSPNPKAVVDEDDDDLRSIVRFGNKR